MGSYTQRKRFDTLKEANEQAAAFLKPEFAITGIDVATKVVEDDGGWWVRVTYIGPLISEDTLAQPGAILPGWERVA